MESRPKQQPDFDDILLLVGRMNYAWTNTESLLIHYIAGLASTTKETGTIIFLTLNTTRARLDLVNRLAKMPSIDNDCRDAVLATTKALSRESQLRNKYNHCIYSFDKDGGKARTILMRINDEKTAITYGKTELLDEREKVKIQTSISALNGINKRMWSQIFQLGFPA